MAETFDNPLKNLLLDKMISDGYFKRDNLDKSTIQTLSDLKDSEVLQLLKSFGVGKYGRVLGEIYIEDKEGKQYNINKTLISEKSKFILLCLGLQLLLVFPVT